MMKRVSTADFIRNFGTYSDNALASPIILTKNDRDRLVVISIGQYDRLTHGSSALEDSQANIGSQAPGKSAR